MTNNDNNKRYYKKEKYETSLGAFIIGIIFIFIAILSLIFMRMKINIFGIRYWGYWMLIPAFFLFIGGFHQIYVNKKYKTVVRNALSNRDYKGVHKLEHLSSETGIEPNDLLRVLLVLRSKENLKYRFNPDNGEIILGETVKKISQDKINSNKEEFEDYTEKMEKNYCIYCGQELDLKTKFCPSCGSNL